MVILLKLKNIDDLALSVMNLKNTVNGLSNNKVFEDDLNKLRKKIEALSSQFNTFKEEHKNPKGNFNIDFSKFVDMHSFIEFKNSTNSTVKHMNERMDELYRFLKDLENMLAEKLNISDFKVFEELIVMKLEELKNACNKKFSDKNETAKNLKFLDQQIKNLLEIYLKFKEKGENWLLAKKPLEGHSCASCEHFIGELHDNNIPIHWKKYPMREQNDKLYRVIFKNFNFINKGWKWF